MGAQTSAAGGALQTKSAPGFVEACYSPIQLRRSVMPSLKTPASSLRTGMKRLVSVQIRMSQTAAFSTSMG